MKSTIGITSRYSDNVFAKVCHTMLPTAVALASAISTFTPDVSVPVRLASIQPVHAATMNARFDSAFIGSASNENQTRSQYSSNCCIICHHSYQTIVLLRGTIDG